APAPRPRPGLRERVKARTREELIDAAFSLFAERGFDAVTVDDIAARADVSPRTFFRYFPVKEDVVLARMEDHTARLVEGLAARPASEPPLVALREALRAPLEELQATPQLCGVLKMVKSHPGVQAHDLARRTRTEVALAEALAERMGMDARSDPRPLLIATTFMAGVGATVSAWLDDGSPGDLDARVDAFTDLMRGGFEPRRRGRSR
ncbi:MAG: TetR family transcriptional regulator, partial [Actinomycetota bacterium]